ncbi:helix-turn-helix domain-containing protein [Halomonas sp. PBN3]|uniref:helix-turn-helix domain-containing protein n=1 Tax=Halomonas sp. PBN3 TaxID=1397528 RepID=UPI0003B8B643|nr:helix-turn-helix transcriptional regulator [Halomonas sp. PBN3]ERS87950.1 hypothetical protein Q671_08550 [Halomonas sp. PBN3]
MATVSSESITELGYMAEHSGGSMALLPPWRQGARQTLAVAATCFLVPFSLGAEPGSGGAMTPEAALSRYDLLQDASIDVAATATADDPLRTPAERLERIRQALSLTVTDLARLLETSRPTVYAWLNGQEPRPDVHERLVWLEQQAGEVDACRLPRINKLVRRPLRCGGSLLDRLQRGESLDEALKELTTLARREQAGRQRQKGLAVAARSPREALDDVAIPLDRRG